MNHCVFVKLGWKNSMDDVIALISEKRLDKYKGISKENALICHLYNSELSESCYQSVCYFEIILRNKIDRVFSNKFGDGWIFDKAFHLGNNKINYTSAITKIINSKEDAKDRNKVVSELNLGFWTYLFTVEYKKIWDDNPELVDMIYENAKNADVYTMSSRLNRIRNFRNKIFHYGSIIVCDDKIKPEKIHNMIYSQIKELGGNSILKKIKPIDRFNEKYKKGRLLGILK